ncbi:MAG: hypothetical protein ABI614_04645, partial [Planctomycetota bacterium]
MTAAIAKASSVTVSGDVSLTAEDDSSILADGGGATVSVAVGINAFAPGVGAGEAFNTVTRGATQAYIDDSTVTAGGQVAVNAISNPDIEAKAFGVAVAVAVSSEGGFAGAGSGAAAHNTIANTTEAYIQNGSTVSAAATGDDAISVSVADDPMYLATSGSGSLGFSVGQVSVALAVGVSLSQNTISSNTVSAYIGELNGSDDTTTVTATNGGVQVSATSTPTVTAKSVAVAATIAIPLNPEAPISVALSGSGASSTNDITNSIIAAIDGGVEIEATGEVSIAAAETPAVNAEATGAAVSLGVISVAVAGTVASSTLNRMIESYVGDNASISAGGLTILASQNQDAGGDATLSASAAAGSGAILAGVNGAKSTASVSGSVDAYTGSNVTLPDGDITIAASSSTLQSTESLGVSAGIIAVGGNDSTASSNVQTSATLGANPVLNTSRTGTLVVQATGSDQNAAWAIAGSGGVFAGDGASAKTDNSSTVAAQLGDGTIYAGNVAVLATHLSGYAPGVNSINASAVGASGAEARNTDTTSAAASIANSTRIVAAGLVTIAAQNQIAQSANPNASDINKGASAFAGAGGVITGDAAGNQATIGTSGGIPVATAAVNVGDSVQISSGTDPFQNPGGIVIAATSGLQANDLVLLSTGGVIAGGGTGSTIDATLTNSIAIGQNGSLSSWGDVGVGTSSSINASSTSHSNVGGLGGTADAHATTNVTSHQNVTVGSGTNIFGFGNVQITAGANPLGLDSVISAASNAAAYAYGLVTIPEATATTSLTSNATLTINGSIQSGQDANLGAFSGDLTLLETWNQYWNSANTQSGPSTTPTPVTSATVTIDGTVAAGAYHELTIDVPASQTNPPQVTVTSSGPASFPIPVPGDFSRQESYAANFSNSTYAPTPGYYAAFNPTDFIGKYFDTASAATLRSGVATGTVAAYVLPALFAAGGQVMIDGSLTGTGTITAHAAPTITINNASTAYLVVNDVFIPDIAAGQILVNGTASSGNTGGVTLTPVTTTDVATLTIDLSYQAAHGANGPGLFLMGSVSNEGGDVLLNNASGSLGQTGAISAASVTVTVPNGVYGTYLPTGVFQVNTFGDPAAQWQSQMIWPGGNPATTQVNTTRAANNAINYVADYIENSSQYSSYAQYMQKIVGYWTTAHVYSTGSCCNPPDLNIYNSIYGRASKIYVGDSIPFFGEFYGGDDSQSHNQGSSGTSSDGLPGSYKIYQASEANNPCCGRLFYGDQYYDGSGNDTRGYIPALNPSLALTKSVTAYPTRTPFTATTAKSLSVTAEWIDMNGEVIVGSTTNSSVELSGTDLQQAIQSFQDQFNAGAIGISVLDIGSYLTTVNVDDHPITATYNAQNRQFVVGNVSSSSDGKVYLNGKIISTYPPGTSDPGAANIQFKGGLGAIEIKNNLQPIMVGGAPFAIPIVIQNVKAAAVAGSLVVIDQNYSPAKQTLYVYEPIGPNGATIKEFVGMAGETLGTGTFTTISGNSLSYQPLLGSAWQWAQTATLSRTEFGNRDTTSWGLNPWQFNFPSGSPNNPWQASAPADSTSTTGNLISDSSLSSSSSSNPVFKQSVSGSINTDFAPEYLYSKFTIVSATDQFYWTYNFPLTATVTLTSTVRADNPINISFSGSSQGTLTIDSTGPVILAGEIDLPSSSVTIDAQGSITQSVQQTLMAQNLELFATSGVGSRLRPLDATLSASVLNVHAGHQGVYLNLNSNATINSIVAGDATQGYGDVILNATGSLTPLGIGTYVEGKNIQLSSSQGNIGTSAAPLVIQTHSIPLANGGVRDGAITVQAKGDIGLSQNAGDLLVRSIASSGGNVFLNVPGGSVYDTATHISPGPTLAEAQAVWQRLGLADPSFGQVGVTAFQNLVEANYQQYWQLLGSGSMHNGAYTLNASAVGVYGPQAAAALNVPNPTPAQVQTYAGSLYGQLVAFFDQNLPADWMSQPEFQTFDPNFAYTATPQQVSNLTLHTRWTTDQLIYANDRVALLSAANIPLQNQSPHVSGKSLTITAGGEVGMVRAAIVISLAAIQNSTLTAEEKAALALAHVAGEALLVGTDAQGKTVTFPDGQAPPDVTPTGVQLTIHRPLLVAVTNSPAAALNVTAPNGITVSQTVGDLVIGTIDSDGAVNLAATGSIRNAQTVVSGFGNNGTGWTTNLVGHSS